MAIVNAKDMLMQATEEKYAVGAFNCTNLIQLEAVVEAATEKNAPLIIQASVTPSKFLGPKVLGAIYRTLAESAPIPICLHLDHCNDVEFCKTCADAGYTNIMIDASKQEFSENIRQTKEVCDYCHGIGSVSVEGELGTVSGIEDQVKVAEDEAALCDPEQAMEFVDKTGIDVFAPAIGTAHGVYKTKNPKLDFDRLKKIAEMINGSQARVPLVIHGGTGLQPDVVTRLVSLGGSKFNVSTDLKHCLIDTTYDYISSHKDEYNPGKIDASVKEAIKGRIKYWIDLLGSEGKA
ncbi:MAG: class II fructose-bisphosphate aldolase [Deltaproteobacteria bacterium]|jgi:ketose-bisphosphate aldolase|nr:class II fructose-bisphosphate aldolase [Deltaproteobacteria bacterium]MBW2669248.1 class II fructose-bisphosphate aldolase [Deltaproteobacteria bacterium]